MPGISLYFVRHGQRIDQVNSAWAETSPCPQDPPLTTQGKMQARQTGKMIKDFAHESSSSASFTSSFGKKPTAAETRDDPQQQQQYWSVQRITPPESPDINRYTLDDGGRGGSGGWTGLDATKRKHHFAIVTSPFLRCSQTAIEMAIGMSGDESCTGYATKPRDESEKDRDLVTISVESGLAEWLSLEYVSEPVPDSIIVQRMQDFAMARRDHERYYGIDWKYIAKDRQLPSWPEAHEDMQSRLERALDHILKFYTGANAKDKDRDLSIVFVTHASPVNALLEACLQTPVLVPVPNCSISRCRWTPLSTAGEDVTTRGVNSQETEPALLDALMQSRQTLTIAGEEGRWLLDYQTYTAHLDRDHRR
ncbi:histidine phosphatase superfamily [Dissophora ornata]|nr:histidine phosphatase superfamily [Dissophora ornata]